MSQLWYLSIDGIAGESVAERHVGAVDVTSWSWGVSSNPVSSGVGADVGRAVIDQLVVGAVTSAATLPLISSCLSRRRIASATLTGDRSGERASELLTYRLSDVVVSAVRQRTGPDGEPIDEVTLHFNRLEGTYRPSSPTGEQLPDLSLVVDRRRP